MLHDAEVGVEPFDESLKDLRSLDRYPLGEDGGAVPLRLPDLLLHVVDCPVGDVDASGLDDTADYRQSSRGRLDVHLVRVELQTEFVAQKYPYQADGLEQGLLPVGHQRHIVHEADVSA